MGVPSPAATPGPCPGERCPWLVCYKPSTAMDFLLCASPGQAAFSPTELVKGWDTDAIAGNGATCSPQAWDEHFHRLLSVFLIENRRL